MTPSTAAKAEPRRATGSDRFTFPLLVGAVHLVVVQVTAALAHLYGTARAGSPPSNYRDPAPINGWLGNLVEPLRNWDGLWYSSIAEQGYASFANANPAYWPLYPWMMELGNRITGWPIEVVGWLIANLAFIVALLFVYWIVQLDFDRQIARTTLWVLALFPMAVFFSAVYTESLFLALAAGALYFARTRAWALAGILGLLAALSRSNGIMLLLPFAVLFIQQYGWSPRRWLTTGLASAAFAILPILGPVLFYLYLDGEGIEQTPTTPAFVEVQGQWFRYSAPPWDTVRCAIVGCEVPIGHEYIDRQQIANDQVDAAGNPLPFQVEGANWSWVSELIRDPSWDTITSPGWRFAFAQSDTVELVAFLLFIGLAVLGLRATPLFYSAYLLPPLLFPLFQPGAVHPLMSIPRFGIVLFPLFVVLALILQRRGPCLAWLTASTALLVLFAIQFAHWYWVS